jgi:hypothetical protein
MLTLPKMSPNFSYLQDGNARCGMKLTNEGARMCIIFILPSSALC